jgi:hypothetical protein
MSNRIRKICIVLTILCILALLIGEYANAHGDCGFECDVPYRIASDGLWYPDGSVPFQTGQVQYFDCNCVKVIILNPYRGSIDEAADIQHWNAVREMTRTHNRNR